MTVHAMEEMAEDDLDILDIEQATFMGGSLEVKGLIQEERGTQ